MWEEFSQNESLTTRIHNILEDYPLGVGSLFEFVQNADDAQAREVKFVLDMTSREVGHKCSTTALEEWQDLPALLVYNSAVMTDSDFQNIKSLGLSAKRSDLSKVGKYGLGFNVVYHFADVVSFLSRDQMAIFDPHGTHLESGHLGIKTNFVHNRLPEIFPGQFNHLQGYQEMMNLDLSRPFDGTIFQLPLRNETLANKSEISSSSFTVDEMTHLLIELANRATESMIFLKHVEKIGIYLRSATGDVQTLQEASIANVRELDSLRTKRSLVNEVVLGSSDEPSADFQLTVVSKNSEKSGSSEWTICSQVDCSPQAADLSSRVGQVPYAAVAVPLDCTVEGRAFCFLPLPILTNLPIHVNASFALTSSRRDLCKSEDSKANQDKGGWNDFLLSQVLPKLYCNLLGSFPGENYHLWPTKAANPPFDTLASQTIKMIVEDKPKLFKNSCGDLLDISNVVFEDPEFTKWVKPDLRFFIEDKINLVSAPSEIRNMLQPYKVFKETSISLIARILREANVEMSLEAASQFVKYVTSSSEFHELPEEVLYQLDGLKLIPLHHGGLGKFMCPCLPPHDDVFLVCPTEISRALPESTFLVNFAAIPSFQELYAVDTSKISNVRELNAENVKYILPDLFPKGWHGRELVVCADRVEQVFGNKSDWKLACIKEVVSSHDDTATATLSKRAAKKLAKQKLKRSRKKKHNKKEVLVDESDGDLSHQTPNGEQVTPDIEKFLMTSQAREAILRRVEVLWKLIAQSDPSFVVGAYPLLPLDQGFLCDLKFAVSRKVILLTTPIDDAEVEVLNKFGVLTCSNDAVLHNSQIKRVLYRRRGHMLDVIRDCMGTEIPASDRVLLRHVVLRLLNDESVVMKPPTIRHLPIFGTRSTTSEMTLVNVDGPVLEGNPNNINRAMGSPGSEALERVSEWDLLLSPLIPEQLLDYESEENFRLLERALATRSDVISFLFTCILPCMTKVDFSQSVCVKILDSVGQLNLWKKQTEGREKRVMDAIASTQIIVFNDGRRQLASECIDPRDKNYSNILFLVGIEDEEAYPPTVYREHHTVMSTLKRAGMQSLSNASCFRRACVIVAENKNEAAGKLLVEHLCRCWQSSCSKWPKGVINEIASIPFVPCLSISSILPINVLNPPRGNTLTKFNEKFGRKLPKVSRSLARRGCQTGEYLKDLASYEEDKISQHDAIGDTDHVSMSFSTAMDMLRLTKSERTALTTNQGNDKVAVVFTSLGVSCNNRGRGFITKSLFNDGLLTYNSALIFPELIDNAPISFLKTFKMSHPPNPIECAKSLAVSSRKWATMDMPWRLKRLSVLKGIVLGSCCILMRALSDRDGLKAFHKNVICSVLSKAPFVLTEDGHLLYPSNVCVDLEVSLSEKVVALPEYLENMRSLLALIGASKLNVVDSPIVKVMSAHPTAGDRMTQAIGRCFNDPALADVCFLHRGSKVYGHKLVLSFASSFFFKLFEKDGGFQESTSGGMTEIPVDADFDPEALIGMLTYIYYGKLPFCLVSKVSVSNSAIVLDLLQLSDMYFLDHLKQSCEAYLTDPMNEIVDLYSCCPLLTHAEACKASQLSEVCLFHIRQMFDVVSKMREWEELPEHLQTLVVLPKKFDKKNKHVE